MVLALILVTSMVSVASVAKAQACKGQACLFGQACNGANSNVCTQAKQQGTTDPIAGPNGVISVAANVIAVVTGVIAVIMIIIGGLRYATAAGNAEQAAGARRQIIYALIGIVVVALAWTITRFVVDKVIQ